jgi:hypothetical protein
MTWSGVSKGMLVLALLVCALWVYTTLVTPERGTALALPIAPGRELHISMWSREERFTTEEYLYSDSVIVDVPLSVMVRLYDRHTISLRYLFTVRLPTWPLLVIAVVLVAIGIWSRKLRPGS